MVIFGLILMFLEVKRAFQGNHEEETFGLIQAKIYCPFFKIRE